MHALLADAVLLLHLAVVLFVVGGLVFVLLGNAVGWRWVNRPWLRWLHLAAIGFVVVQSWLGATCPLTTLESWLRTQAGQSAYTHAGFIEHWVSRLLFYEAPPLVFVVLYSGFGALVVLAWWRWPPRGH